MANEPYTVVTPEQYAQGYLEFPGVPRPYALIKKLANGNYLVKNPGAAIQEMERK